MKDLIQRVRRLAVLALDLSIVAAFVVVVATESSPVGDDRLVN